MTFFFLYICCNKNLKKKYGRKLTKSLSYYDMYRFGYIHSKQIFANLCVQSTAFATTRRTPLTNNVCSAVFHSCSGPLTWLDGSEITYSSWVRSPQPGAAWGHILRDSGFQWEATRDCNKRLPFICQFGMCSES